MVVVNLIDNYFVEVDEMNHTLKQKFTGKDKDGNEKQSVRIIGYFPNMPSCIEKIARLNTISELDGQLVELKEYACKAEEAFVKCSTIKLYGR